MARTHGRIKVEVWDVGSDFRHLTVDAQWAYEMLISQPQITMCGTLPFTPKKWAKLASDLTLARIESAVEELEGHWYVIVDRDTDELLVRTMVKHDRAWANPKLAESARRRFKEIESESIREYLTSRHAWLSDEDLDPEQYESQNGLRRATERTFPLPIERAS